MKNKELPWRNIQLALRKDHLLHFCQRDAPRLSGAASPPFVWDAQGFSYTVLFCLHKRRRSGISAKHVVLQSTAISEKNSDLR